MNKKILSICISIVVCIIILISGFLLISQIFPNKLPFSRLSLSKLEKMTDSELKDLFYTLPRENGFVNKAEKEYEFSYECADSVEDAIEKTKDIGQSSNTETVKLKLQKETAYYYVIYQEYISHGGPRNWRYNF